MALKDRKRKFFCVTYEIVCISGAGGEKEVADDGI